MEKSKAKGINDLTQADVEKFLSLCATMPTIEAAKQLDFRYETAYRVAKKHGVFKKAPAGKMKGKTTLSAEDKVAFLALCAVMPTYHAAKKIGLRPLAAYQIAEENGVFSEAKASKYAGTDILNKAFEYVAQGYAINAAARMVGIKKQTFRYHIKAAKRKSNPKPKPDSGEFQAYIPDTHRRCGRCKKIRLLDFFHTSTICVHCAK